MNRSVAAIHVNRSVAAIHVNASLVKVQGATQPVVENVLEAFNAVFPVGTELGYNKGPLFPEGYTKQSMPYSEHFQGIQRLQNSNHLVVSGSGLTEHSSQLFLVDLASASATGAFGTNVANGEGPPATDTVVQVASFDSEYDHAGGFQVWGDYLAVGAEAGCSATERMMGQCEERSRIHFFDVSDPTNMVKLDYTVERPDATAGAVALMQEADGRFLLVVGRVDCAIIDFYRSTKTSLATDPGFASIGTWYKASLTNDPSTDDYFGQYQTLNMVRQADGQLFLAGFYRSSSAGIPCLGDDFADLYELNVPSSSAGAIVIHKVASQHLVGSDISFCAGAGLYVASPTSFDFYAVDWVPRQGVITLNEFASGGCPRDTGGSCSMFPCSSSRGPTDCSGKKCLCQTGYCATAAGVCEKAAA